jgi:prephenate dehydratase
MIHVSFQGERGAYSEAAARAFFDEEIETIPLTTFTEVLENTSKDRTQYAILPVENSLEGSVGESYDLLYSTSLNAIGEIYHRIEHCLIGIGKLDQNRYSLFTSTSFRTMQKIYPRTQYENNSRI